MAGDALLFGGAAVCLLLPVSPALALAGGGLLALSIGHTRGALLGRWTGRLLQLAVVGLGASMDLRTVARVGLHGLGYTVVGIAGTLLLGSWLGRRLRLRPHSALLVSLGTAICGGSAIAAAAPVLEADGNDTSVALTTVFLLNAVALFLFPAVGHALHLSQAAFGLWAALAIHDTSSVVAAGLAFGPVALATATSVKLARALWIVPATTVLGWRRKRERAPVPLFIVGFAVAAALGTFVPSMHALAPAIAGGARHLVALSLFLVGARVSRTALEHTGWKPLAHGALLWLVVGSVTLTAIRFGWIG